MDNDEATSETLNEPPTVADSSVLPTPIPDAEPLPSPELTESANPIGASSPLAPREERDHAGSGLPSSRGARGLLAVEETAPPDSVPELLPIPQVDDGTWTTVWLTPTASRRLTESLIIFLGAILFLRALAVEPFGVPTGSMAPTLHGNHKCVDCPRCGYPIRVGEASDDQRNGQRKAQADAHRYLPVTCPNCGQPNIDLSQALLVSGDRLLVDKNIFQLRKPRRWEPAVFRCPSDPEKPYVKRVIGLPGERVLVYDGDIWINDQIARKSLKEARECRVLVFDMKYPPKSEGWAKRWIIESNLPPADMGEAVESGFKLASGELRLDGQQSARSALWVAYRNHRFDETGDSEREEPIRDGFIYNGTSGDDRANAVHDFFVEFEIEIVGGSGSLQCRLSDGLDQMIASCPIGEHGDAQLRREGFGTVRTVTRKPLQQSTKYRIEMAFVDRRISFAIDGSEPFPAYDLPPVEARPDVVSPFAVAVQGANLVIRDLRIFRDIYYRSTGQNGIREPLPLAVDEYFMLGDNSANSHDSRSWPIPGVPERNFLGKPFLLHQPSRVTHMKVFGSERIFQSIDWSRLRFLR